MGHSPWDCKELDMPEHTHKPSIEILVLYLDVIIFTFEKNDSHTQVVSDIYFSVTELSM